MLYDIRSLAKAKKYKLRKIVSVALVMGNTVWLSRRSAASSAYPLHWQFPGGKLENGESPLAGAARELEEETGLVIRPSKSLVLVDCIDLVGRDPMTINRQFHYVLHMTKTLVAGLRHDTEPAKIDTGWMPFSIQEVVECQPTEKLLPGARYLLTKLFPDLCPQLFRAEDCLFSLSRETSTV